MTTVAATGRPSRPRRLVKVALWLGAIALALVLLDLIDADVRGWLRDFWDVLTEISLRYLVAAIVLQTAQTAFTALAWLAILRAAYADVEIPFAPILTTYAVAVALNGVVPANLGTLVMLLMFIAIIPGSTFTGVFAGYLVHKIFFTVAGGAVYLYLFLSVPGSFSIELEPLANHPALTLIIVGGAIFLVMTLVRLFWPKLQGLWRQVKEGGQVLGSPRRYFTRVFFPEFLAYLAKFGVIAIFLAAYAIPVTFHTVMTVVGGNSIANVASFTPGGVGINQAINTAALSDVTDPTTATAYSLAQQLLMTAWNIVFAVILVVIVFGWSGGTTLVRTSYVGAKEKAGQLRGKSAEAEEAEEA